MKIKQKKNWTKILVPGGGYILTRAIGQELKVATAAAIAELKISRGFPVDATDGVAAVAEAIKLTPEQLVDGLLAAHDSPFTAADKENLLKFGHLALWQLAAKFSCVSAEEVTEINRREEIGQTFGGFGDFLDEDTGEPIPDRNAAGHLDVEMCLTLLGLDEVFEVYTESIHRLTAQRTEKWNAAAKNLPAPSAGSPAGGTPTAVN